MINTNEPLVIEHIFNASVSKVWEAITQLDQMKKWFFENIPVFKPEVGFTTQFEVHNEGRKFTHLWEITQVIPHHKITYNWKYKEYPGDSFVTFELLEEQKGLRLKLSMEVIDVFPEEIPEFTKESCLSGWNYFLGKNLKAYLEGTDR